ncbi:hypothetical protein [Terriglobus albidus]|uniref:hypothetical protein n=1 Tax=Terriglobus albidus TaxID=1592106 RepID=UPI0021E08706|nr:hypothetical protein [Terriglobus albidus]
MRLYVALQLGISTCLILGPRPILSQDVSHSLDEILNKAQANIESYRTSVPNVYCTEHAVANRKIPNSSPGPASSTPASRAATIEDSAESSAIFRLKRLPQPSENGIFEESRISQHVTYSSDAPGYEMFGIPALLYGVFSNGLNILSPEARQCFSFNLRKVKQGKPIVVEFADLPADQRAAGCLAFQNARGAIQIDPETMHVAQIERSVPRQVLVGDIKGEWTWKEKYSPVTLMGKTFWLPNSITSRSVSSDQRSVWTFDATYKDYHLFYSTTRILPDKP